MSDTSKRKKRRRASKSVEVAERPTPPPFHFPQLGYFYHSADPLSHWHSWATRGPCPLWPPGQPARKFPNLLKQSASEIRRSGLLVYPEVAAHFEGKGVVRRVSFPENGPDAWFSRLVVEGDGQTIPDEALKEFVSLVQVYTETKLAPGVNVWEFIHEYLRYAAYVSEGARKAILASKDFEDKVGLPDFPRWLRAGGKERLIVRSAEDAPGDRRGVVRREREGRAIACLIEHPDWGVARIAKEVGVPRTTPYGWPRFMNVLKARNQEAQERKAQFPRASDLPASYQPGNGDE